MRGTSTGPATAVAIISHSPVTVTLVRMMGGGGRGYRWRRGSLEAARSRRLSERSARLSTGTWDTLDPLDAIVMVTTGREDVGR